MNPELTDRVLRAAELLRQAIEDCAHPGAVEDAVRSIYGTTSHSCCDEGIRASVVAALGACEKATDCFAWNAEYAAEVLLRSAQKSLSRLVADAELVMASEGVFA